VLPGAALVEWKDGDFIVRDAGSRNGVLLNGERVDQAPLTSDDQIRIGERVFTFLAGEENAVSQHFLHQRRKRHSGGTDIINVVTLPRPSGGFAGSLKDFPLAELLQALDLGRKTGRVEVVCEDLRGEMLLCEGRVVDASLGGLTGEDAAYAMLSLGDGTFDFEARAVEEHGGLDASTASLLMEALRRIDEERRAQTEAGDAPGTEAPDGEPQDESHDSSLDTKHGDEMSPEAVAAGRGETMTIRRSPTGGEADTSPAQAVSTGDVELVEGIEDAEEIEDAEDIEDAEGVEDAEDLGAAGDAQGPS